MDGSGGLSITLHPAFSWVLWTFLSGTDRCQVATPDPRTAPSPVLALLLGEGKGMQGGSGPASGARRTRPESQPVDPFTSGRAWLMLGDTMLSPDTRAEGGGAPTGGSGWASTHPALLGGAPASHVTRARSSPPQPVVCSVT